MPAPVHPASPSAAPESVHHVLLVEDSDDDAELIRAQLATSDRRIVLRRVESATEMQAALDAMAWDLVISDNRLPRFDALKAYDLLRRSQRDVPFIIVSGSPGDPEVVAALRLGADDCIDKANTARLVPVVECQLHARRARVQRGEAPARVPAADRGAPPVPE